MDFTPWKKNYLEVYWKNIYGSNILETFLHSKLSNWLGINHRGEPWKYFTCTYIERTFMGTTADCPCLICRLKNLKPWKLCIWIWMLCVVLFPRTITKSYLQTHSMVEGPSAFLLLKYIDFRHHATTACHMMMNGYIYFVVGWLSAIKIYFVANTYHLPQKGANPF